MNEEKHCTDCLHCVYSETKGRMHCSSPKANASGRGDFIYHIYWNDCDCNDWSPPFLKKIKLKIIRIIKHLTHGRKQKDI